MPMTSSRWRHATTLRTLRREIERSRELELAEACVDCGCVIWWNQIRSSGELHAMKLSCMDGERLRHIKYRKRITSAVRASLARSPGALLPQKEIEFEIDGDAISRCLRGLLALFSLLLVDLLSRSAKLPYPTLQTWTILRDLYLQKVGRYASPAALQVPGCHPRVWIGRELNKKPSCR